MNLGPNGQSTSKRLAKAGLLVAAVAVLSGVCAGASWASGYDPSTDPNSISSTAAYTGAKQWWSAGYTGKGVDVAVIDSGVAPVQGLGAPDKVLNGPDLSLESQAPNLPYLDTYGHGTFMAGLIAGRTTRPGTDYAKAPASTYLGIAPDARIISAEGRHGRRRHRRLAGDRGNRLGRPARARPRPQHPRPQPLLRHELAPGLHERPARLRGRAGLEARDRGRRVGREHRLPARQRRPGLADPAYDPYVIATGASDSMGTPSLGDDAVASFSRERREAGAPGTRTSSPPGATSRVCASRTPGSTPTIRRGCSSRPLLPRQRHLRVRGCHLRRGGARAPAVPDASRPTC